MAIQVGDKCAAILLDEYGGSTVMLLTINIVVAPQDNNLGTMIGFEGISVPGMGPVWPAKFFSSNRKRLE